MRILVLSDSHERVSLLELAIAAQPAAQHLFFLGDGLADIDSAAALFPKVSVFKVCGNCDFSGNAPLEGLETLGGKRIFFTHGHRLAVKLADAVLAQTAAAQRADIVLYGHTHVPVHRFENGIHFFNPGALKDGRYGVIDLEPNGTAFLHMKI